ncbi:hypothetical protein NDU88_005242 [Pleurodeles waltl]|uniref:Uncharacterized protein n=1 Tax=Pleurodeles waltl TaxID=8319 RepID=A0AAV7TAS1_PLEWA|nr:hypothetical protein NDU88_005242 [Pleurodeles waltl]
MLLQDRVTGGSLHPLVLQNWGQRPGTTEWHRGLVVAPWRKPQVEQAGKWASRQEMVQSKVAPVEYEGVNFESTWLDFDEESMEEGEIREDKEGEEQGWSGDSAHKAVQGIEKQSETTKCILVCHLEMTLHLSCQRKVGFLHVERWQTLNTA